MNPRLHEDNVINADVVVSTPVPAAVNVDYLEETSVPVSVTNMTDTSIVVDQITLQFKTNEAANSKDDGRITQNCENGAVKPQGTRYWNVRFRPNLFLREYTNDYSVEVIYRRDENGRLSTPLKVVKPAGFSYLIIQTPPAAFGKVFISYKDNEDLELAKSLFALARRAGFSPYMAPPDLKPGRQIWDEKIIPSIKDSVFAFIIWTEHTDKGPGVVREIKLCREFGKKEVLLLEKSASVPVLYQSKQYKELERVRFKRAEAIKTFAEVVIARRLMSEGE